MKKLYEKRHGEYGNLFGGGVNKKQLKESEQDKLNQIAYLDETDIETHQIKLLFENVMGWGLRGSEEHSILEVKHVEYGVLEERHEFAGSEWYGYDHFVDKSHKLSANNGYVRDNRVRFIVTIFCSTFISTN